MDFSFKQLLHTCSINVHMKIVDDMILFSYELYYKLWGYMLFMDV
jgi:hypothetical protein